MIIKRQNIFSNNGIKRYKTALVFSSLARYSFSKQAPNRSLQFLKKIRNPIVRFDLLQGPLDNSKDGLNLEKGSIDETLLFQVSEDGSNWNTIRTFTPSQNIFSTFTDDRVFKELGTISLENARIVLK